MATKEQNSFRFYENGTESGAAALADQNTGINVDFEETFHLRVGAQYTDDPAAEAATLQYKESGDKVHHTNRS